MVVFIGKILIGIGLAIIVITDFWLLLIAYKKHILWLLACLFIPVASIALVISNWENAKKPFLIQLAASVLICIGFVLMPN